MKSFLAQCAFGVSAALLFVVPLSSAQSASLQSASLESASSESGLAGEPIMSSPCTDFMLFCAFSDADCRVRGGIIFPLACNGSRVCCSL